MHRHRDGVAERGILFGSKARPPIAPEETAEDPLENASGPEKHLALPGHVFFTDPYHRARESPSTRSGMAAVPGQATARREDGFPLLL